MEQTLVRRNDKILQVPIALGLLAVVFGLSYFMAAWLPEPVDWTKAFRPACLRLLSGQSPYVTDGAGFFNPVWTLIPLIPIAVLPPLLGRAMLTLCTWMAYGFAAYRLGAKPVSVVAILYSYPVVSCLAYGQIDWLVALGFVLPPQWGLLFVLTKPQAGMGIALYWLWRAWRENGVRGVVHLATPTAVGLLLSAAVLLADPRLGQLSSDSSLDLWPYLVPLGLALLIGAAVKKNAVLAIPAAQCLSPYVQRHSLTGILLAAARSAKLTVALSLASWALMFLGD